MSWRQTVIAILMLLRGCALAQNLPDLGKQLCSPQSYSGRNIANGCEFRFDKGSCQLVCDSALSGIVAQVTLTQGTTTTVSNARARADSIVDCGCGGGSAACNLGGTWLARLWTKSVAAGTYTIGHSFALGNETVTCVLR